MFLAQDKGIGIVVHDYDAMPTGESHQPLIGFTTGTATGRHIRIVRPEEADRRQAVLTSAVDNLLQLLKVGLPAVVLLQVVVHHLGTQQT